MQRHLTAQLDELRADPTLESQEGENEGGGATASLRQRVLDMYRPLTEADVDRIRAVQTPLELLDCSHHFHLHYGDELAAMREFEARTALANKKPAAKEKRKKKKKARNRDDDHDDDEERRADEDEEDEDEDEDDENDEDEAEEEGDDEAAAVGDVKVIKYASKKDRYHHCKLAGLCGLAKKFGLTPEQLGENVECDYQKHEIEQWAVAPADEAQNYVKEPYFSSVEHVKFPLISPKAQVLIDFHFLIAQNYENAAAIEFSQGFLLHYSRIFVHFSYLFCRNLDYKSFERAMSCDCK